MGGISIWQLLIIVAFVAGYLFPIIHVLVSKRSYGGAKFGWVIATVMFSLLAYCVFLIVTQPKKDTTAGAKC